MCSVDGFTGKHKYTIEQYAAINSDRGPDGTNYWCDEYVSIAHSLLAIQDNPNNTAQPVERGDYVLSYNGEIYGIDEFDTDYLMDILIEGNWAKLKYETNGMWAFSLYNKKDKTLTLCRDHLGVKALYWMRHNNEIYWSSTPKPLIAVCQESSRLLREVGYDNSLNFLDGFWLSPETPYYGIRRVPPGGIIQFDLKEKRVMFSDDNLWGNDTSRFNLHPRNNWDPDEYKELAEKAIRDVCTAPNKRKCISLSGGLDSTLIASLNRHQDNLFCSTISFEPVIDDKTTTRLMHESVLAEKTCKEFGLEWTTTEIKRKWQKTGDFEEAVKRIGAYMWLGSRIVPRYRNVKNASENGAKIYIVGDLADEILTGYSGHCWYYLGPEDRRITNNAHWINPWQEDQKYENFMKDQDQGHFYNWYPKHLHGIDKTNNHLFWRLMMSVDSFNGLVDNLAGSYGMESRVPYMHQEFVKYVMKIPSHDKLRLPTKRDIRKGQSVLKPPAEQHFDDQGFNIYAGSYKRLIRDEMSEYIPDHVNSATNKVGFSVPWNARNAQLNDQIRMAEAETAWKVIAKEYKF